YLLGDFLKPNSLLSSKFGGTTVSPIPVTPQEAPYPWYAIRTKSGHEKITATVLNAKGYELYFPVYKSKRRWSDRTVELKMPLFPGYVFCRFDANCRLPIISSPGVVAIIGVGKQPAPI